jgi:hypothetical protein
VTRDVPDGHSFPYDGRMLHREGLFQQSSEIVDSHSARTAVVPSKRSIHVRLVARLGRDPSGRGSMPMKRHALVEPSYSARAGRRKCGFLSVRRGPEDSLRRAVCISKM